MRLKPNRQRVEKTVSVDLAGLLESGVLVSRIRGGVRGGVGYARYGSGRLAPSIATRNAQ